ncbi:MAG: hypothetical protein IPL61_11420 [Myxococcales bacterium]|nr:hypothetical protein [Myxococcales bacterium]
MRGAGLALGAALACACGSSPRSSPPSPSVPTRAATAGDALLPRLPPGAALVVELDLARLRANPAVGAVARAVIDGGAAPVDAVPSAAALVDADAVVLAAYAVGRPDAHTLTVVQGGHRPRDGVALTDDVWVLTDEGEAAAILAVAPGASLADDAALMAARAAVMPAAAEGAAIRVAARFDDDARRGLREALETAAAPTALAAWLDVADDLAAIVWVDGVDVGAVTGWRDRLAAVREVRALGLTPPLAAAEVVATRGGATATIVIGPGRLARAVARWQAHGEP